MENKTKARCQVANKAMKTKLTNMLRRKEGKKEIKTKVTNMLRAKEIKKRKKE